MTPPASIDHLNRRLAKLLSLGTWLACALIALGMILSPLGLMSGRGELNFALAGIVLLVSLPTLRVAAMGMWFLRHRDLEFALFAAVVLTIIIVSALIGATVA